MNRALSLLKVILRHLVGALTLLIGASALIYLTVRAAPGNALDAIIPIDTPPDIKAELLADFGLDQGPIGGFISWLVSALQGDLGICIGRSFQGLSVQEVALPAFSITLSLAAFALFSCFLICLLLAVWSGGQTGPTSKFSGPLYILTSAPCFVAAVLLIQTLNYSIHHYVDQAGYVPPIWHPLPGATDSIVPSLFAALALVIGDGLFMEYYNALSAQIRQVQQAQFIAAIRSKGAALFPHIAKNLIVPFLTGFSARLPLVLGSAVIVEYIFTLEGAGYALLEAAKERDFPLVVGLCVLFTATVVALGFIVDIVRAIVDPREVSRGA